MKTGLKKKTENFRFCPLILVFFLLLPDCSQSDLSRVVNLRHVANAGDVFAAAAKSHVAVVWRVNEPAASAKTLLCRPCASVSDLLSWDMKRVLQSSGSASASTQSFGLVKKYFQLFTAAISVSLFRAMCGGEDNCLRSGEKMKHF